MGHVQMWNTVKKGFRFLKNDRFAFPVLLLLLTGLVHGIAFTWMPVFERDAVTYVTASAHWAATGKYLLPHFPPLPCFIIKLLIQTGLSPETAGKCFCFLTGLPVPLIGYFIALKAAGNKRVARYTAFMLIFHPMLIYFSVQPIRDSAYILLVSLLLLAALDALKKQTPAAWLLCAFYTAAGWVCRYEMMEFFLVLPLVVFLRVWQRSYPWKKAFLHLVIYGFCSLALWCGLTLGIGGREVFASQYDTYIKHKLVLLVERWKF